MSRRQIDVTLHMKNITHHDKSRIIRCIAGYGNRVVKYRWVHPTNDLIGDVHCSMHAPQQFNASICRLCLVSLAPCVSRPLISSLSCTIERSFQWAGKPDVPFGTPSLLSSKLSDHPNARPTGSQGERRPLICFRSCLEIDVLSCLL